MPRPRLRTLVVLAAIAAPLSSASPAGAATPDWNPGPCRGSEGVTVVVDLNPTDDSAPGAPVHVRCALGMPASGIEALEVAGFAVATHDQWGDPFVCGIDGLPKLCVSNAGFWSYWSADAPAGEWSFAPVGAATSSPSPTRLEGWRWVQHFADDALPPRALPAAATVTDAAASVEAHALRVTATIAAGGVEQQAWVEYSTSADGSGATRTATQVVPAGATRALAFRVPGLAADTVFTWRVVTSGALGTVSSPWRATATTRAAARLDLRAPARFVRRGRRVVVRVSGLGANERVTLRLHGVRIGAGRANAAGVARLVARIPSAAPLGGARLIAQGETADRTGARALHVTKPARLAVTARALARGRVAVAVRGLARFEPVVVRQRGVVVARGVASPGGRFVRSFRSPARAAGFAVVVSGSDARRRGAARVRSAAGLHRRATKR